MGSMEAILESDAKLAQLDYEIAGIRSEIANLKRARKPLKRAVARSSRELRYLQFLKWLRSPARQFRWYKDTLILAAPIATTIAVCGIIFFTARSSLLTLVGAPVTFAPVFGLLLLLMNRPSDAELPASIANAQERLASAVERYAVRRATDGLSQCEMRLRELRICRQGVMRQIMEEIDSGKRARAALLSRNWKAMRDYEWEAYLVEVFRAHGAKAERIGGAGDQGVDLIVEFGAKRIAIQAKGYFNTVSNKAIQEAYAGMAHHGCCAGAVITNSRFTRGAMELAVSTGCVLIGEEEFPDFVMGKVSLWPPAPIASSQTST
jgi:hypothetical protein